MNTHKCTFCNKEFASMEGLENHIEKFHKEQIGDLSGANYLFNLRNKKDYSNCVVKAPGCKIKTTFNEKSKKYNRICNNPKCKEEYVKLFKDRMVKKYGKEHLLNDPDIQKNMLGNRNISGTYKFSDGTLFKYTGTYELNFLQYLDIGLNWATEDLISPAPFVVPYKFEDKERFYIPDFYIPSLDLVIEVKGLNKHYQTRDKKIENAKDKALEKSKHNYIKIVDKDYDEFLEGLIERKWKIIEIEEKRVTVNEDILLSGDYSLILNEMVKNNSNYEILQESNYFDI
jgi:hypothetical protein